MFWIQLHIWHATEEKPRRCSLSEENNGKTTIKYINEEKRWTPERSLIDEEGEEEMYKLRTTRVIAKGIDLRFIAPSRWLSCVTAFRANKKSFIIRRSLTAFHELKLASPVAAHSKSIRTSAGYSLWHIVKWRESIPLHVRLACKKIPFVFPPVTDPDDKPKKM